MRLETWPEVVSRLGRAREELESMLEHLSSRPAFPGLLKRERELKRWLRPAIDWIGAVLELGKPVEDDDCEEFVLELYYFDLERAAAVDTYVWLLEQGGEAMPM